MPSLRHIARQIRHHPWLRKANFLWDGLRPLWHRLQDPTGRGVNVRLGNHDIRVPPELIATNPDWSAYEYPTFSRLSAWLEANPNATMLDIGSSFGVFSTFFLQASPATRVIAFDSNDHALRAMEAVVPSGCHPRMQRVIGLLGEEHKSNQSLSAAIASTLDLLPDAAPRKAISLSTFVCFDAAEAPLLPWHSVDGLWQNVEKPSAPFLLKCDVEGAEYMVLKGAVAFIQQHQPAIFLSVHPQFLPRFGHDVPQIKTLLTELGYEWFCYDVDHEEHWFAYPSGSQIPPGISR